MAAEQISLGFQFVASFSWMIGASLAGPEGPADYLQLFAAVAWCLANFSMLWSMMMGAKDSADTESNTTTAKTVKLQGAQGV